MGTQAAKFAGNVEGAVRDSSTLAGQTANLHDELIELEQTVSLLESALEPVLKSWPTGTGDEGEALEALPLAVDGVRQAGFRTGAVRRRLYELRQRLAL